MYEGPEPQTDREYLISIYRITRELGVAISTLREEMRSHDARLDALEEKQRDMTYRVDDQGKELRAHRKRFEDYRLEVGDTFTKADKEVRAMFERDRRWYFLIAAASGAIVDTLGNATGVMGELRHLIGVR